MNVLHTQLATALQQRQAPLRVFWRDDDADEAHPSLRRLLELFARHQTPLNLAVIPGRLTAAGIALLKEYQAHFPGTFELNQHGWQHLNHEPAGHKKCEFGASRSYNTQLADLAAGQAQMNTAFGDAWFAAFIPPWNRCEATTAQALLALGFRALSRTSTSQALAVSHLPEFPVTLDVFQWQGGAQLRAHEALTQDLLAQIATAETIGIMLHHKVMDDAAFELVDEWLTVFAQAPMVERHTLQSLFQHHS